MNRDLVHKAAHVVPSECQYNWQAMEFTAFIHFGANTFTDREWGTGSEDPKLFHPADLDTDQWCKFLSENGFKLAILTVKHHEGFCIWPTRYTNHSVVSSDWRDGQGDVLADFAASCKKYGIKAGIYLSPADLYQMESKPGVGSGLYGNESQARPVTIPSVVPGARAFQSDQTFSYELDDYNTYFMNQLYEVLTEYGDIWEIWFDGAHPARKGDQQYNTQAWGEMIRALQPSIIIHGNGFQEIRWVGNEEGFAREEEWSVVPAKIAAHTPWQDKDLGSRDLIDSIDAESFVWMPAETDVSIRPGWFYHALEDDAVKSVDHLCRIYLESIGRNSTLLLSYPPDRVGVIHANDVKHTEAFMAKLRAALAVDFAEGASVSASNSADGHAPEATLDGRDDTCWCTVDQQETAELEWTLERIATFNMIVLQEQVKLGQRVEKFELQARADGHWQTIARGSTIGYKRVVHLPRPVTAGQVKLCITASRFAPTLKTFSLHDYKDCPVAPEIVCRDGLVAIGLPEKRVFKSRNNVLESDIDTTGYQIRYTTDGSAVTAKSPVYAEPIAMISGCIKAKCFVEDAGDLSESSESSIRVHYPKEHVTVRATPTGPGEALVLELRDVQAVNGIAFSPVSGDAKALVCRFSLATSLDGETWQTVYDNDQFGNLENDPTRRERRFAAVRARYVRFIPLASVNDAFDATNEMLDIFVAGDAD